MEEKLKTYFEPNKEVAAAYLFGSHALNKNSPGSDVDIAVLLYHEYLKKSGKIKERFMLELSRLLRKDIDLVIMNDAGELLLYQIYKNGKSLFIRDYQYAKDFEIKSLALYYDFKYYLDKIQKGFIENLGAAENG